MLYEFIFEPAPRHRQHRRKVGFGSFSTDSSWIVGRLMSASARERRTGAEPEALRLAGLP
jgi:hypothetical protein